MKVIDYFRGNYHCNACGKFVNHQDLVDGWADYNDDAPPISGSLKNWKPIVTCKRCNGYD